jgi:protein-S-isoprenylcysteine O-methyltransferase Ste14
MSDSFFTIVYFMLVFTAGAIRGVYARRYKQSREHSDRLDKSLAALPALGMFLFPLVYALTGWLDFADYQLLTWVGWIGTALMAAAVWLLWRSHADLGRHWSVKVELQEDHQLVTQGVFNYIRHPIYAAHLLWGIAQPLLLWNWIAGLSMLLFSLPLYLYRIPKEEEMMAEAFGEEYHRYMKRTGRYFPRLN